VQVHLLESPDDRASDDEVAADLVKVDTDAFGTRTGIDRNFGDVSNSHRLCLSPAPARRAAMWR
jgi:hypothetical protein